MSHGLDNEVSTYAQGRKCLYYIFVSSNLLKGITGCGIKPFHYRIHSDHRSAYLNINKTHFFGDLHDIQRKQFRDINAQHPKSNTIYINQVHKHLIENNIFTKAATLKIT